MKFYWVKTHWIVKKLLPKYVWSLPTDSKIVYLTFDDGPTPGITEWVLEQLAHFDAKATFFCIGNNIVNHRDIFERTVAAGHAIGNHTFNHMNGWHTDDRVYLANVEACEKELTHVSTALFRPPYAKLGRAQSKAMFARGYKIIMWDVLSADFDQTITKEKCLENVIGNIRPGSIVIFHDSIKASENLRYALPKTLQFLKDNGFSCEPIAI